MRTKSREITNLIEGVRVIRDRYSRKYDSCKSDYEAKQKQIMNDYINARLDDEMKKARAEYNQTIAEEREVAKKSFADELQKIVILENAKASVTESTLLNEVRRFEGMEITKREFNLLLEKYGNKNFWSDKILRKIAEENSIDMRDLENPLEADYDAKMEILEELTKAINEYIDKYDMDSTQYPVELGVAESTLFRMESGYLNGLSNTEYTEMQLGERAVSIINQSKDIVEKSKRIANAMQTESQVLKAKIMNDLLQDNANMESIRFSGYKAEFEAFEHELFKSAVETVKIIEAHSDDMANVKDAIKQTKDNKFVGMLLKDSNNREIKKAYEEVTAE